MATGISDAHLHYPARLRLRTPKGLPAAIEMAARHRHTTPAEYARQALLRSIEADGVRLLPDGQIEGRGAA
jgi:hypothetical protein